MEKKEMTTLFILKNRHILLNIVSYVYHKPFKFRHKCRGHATSNVIQRQS